MSLIAIHSSTFRIVESALKGSAGSIPFTQAAKILAWQGIGCFLAETLRLQIFYWNRSLKVP